MDFPTKKGSGRMLYRGKVVPVDWKPRPNMDYGTIVTLPNGHEFEVEDYEHRFDYVYSASDDGYTFYEVGVLLASDEEEPNPRSLPEVADLQETMSDALFWMANKVASGDIDASDMKFAMNLFTIPECMYRMIQKHGSVDKARQAMLSDVWSLPLGPIATERL